VTIGTAAARSRKMTDMNRITLDYGADAPLVLDVAPGHLVADLAGPDGVAGAAAERLVAAALAAPPAGPPLRAHAVPGDRIVIAVSGAVPQARHVVAAVAAQFASVGTPPPDVAELHAGAAAAGLDAAHEHGADSPTEVAYLGADEAGRPLQFARRLVDADLVVTVGEWSFDAALGGRSLEGELWPAFGRRECADDLLLDLARNGRRALPRWLAALRSLTWQLGATSCLRVVAGRGSTLAAAAFGTGDEAARRARGRAAAWAPAVARPADAAVCSLSTTAGGFRTVTRAVAAAARVTRPGGTICVATTLVEPPGPVVTRWRQGAPLRPLLREACRSGDRDLVADAVVTRFLARGLGDRRLVLLSNLDEATVEDLEFGHAATPDVVARLACRSENLVLLHEADLMLPSLA